MSKWALSVVLGNNPILSIIDFQQNHTVVMWSYYVIILLSKFMTEIQAKVVEQKFLFYSYEEFGLM